MVKKKISLIIVATIIASSLASASVVLAEEFNKDLKGSKTNITSQKLSGLNLSGEINNFINQGTSKVKKWELLENKNINEYNKVFKVQKEEIKSISNNGGKYFSSTIDKAIDDNFSTHWETGKPNSSSFTNEVTITLNKATILDRIIYSTRRDGALGKGFPKKFKIFTSESESGDDFNLVCDGSYSGGTGDIVEISFRPTEFKRVKFVFVEANMAWASASEFMLYKPDETLKKIDNIFKDNTFSSLKDEYKNLDYINRLQKEAENHPLKDVILNKIGIAKNIINNKLDTKNTLFKVEQFGDMSKYGREVLDMATQGENFQVTGLYALPNDNLKVYVEAEDGKPMPRLVFSQNEGSFSHWRKTIYLHKGLNEIIVPKISRDKYYRTNPKSGGAIYIENPYTVEEQGKTPLIRIEGAKRFPLFKKGDNEEKFKSFLVEYKKKLDEDNKSGTNKVLDLTEIDSERMTLSVTASGAYDAYINKEIKPSETTAFWDNTMNDLYKYYGFDGSSKENTIGNIKEHMRLAQPFGAMYAYGDHIGVQRSAVSSMLNPEVVKNGSWGFIHEIGHRMDTNGRTWSEVTNNMMPMYMGVKFGHLGHELPYESDIYPNVAPNSRLEPYVNGHFFESLGLFWQLQIYNSNYWTDLNKLYRKNHPNPRSEQEKRNTLIEYSSKVLNLDLSEYFKRHGFEADENTLKEVSKYSKPDKKIWYLNSNCLNYNSGTIDKSAKPVLDNNISEDNFGRINLKFTSSIPKEKLLGYEIVRNKEVIGFTCRNSFNDETAKPNINYEYKIVAYGKDLSTSGESNRVNYEVKRAYTTLDKSNWSISSNLKTSSGKLENIIDGRIDRYSTFEGRKPSEEEVKNEGLNRSEAPYLLLDMKEKKDFEGFEYCNATLESSNNGMVKNYNLYISDDGKNFTEIAHNKEIPKANEKGRKKVILDKTYSARYIKLQCVKDIKGDNLISAVEFAPMKKVREIGLDKIDITSKEGTQKEYEINTSGKEIDFDVNLYPYNSTKKEVSWCVLNAKDNSSVSKYITIDENGVLKPTGISFDGKVKVIACSKYNPNLKSEVICTVVDTNSIDTKANMKKFELLNNENLSKYNEKFKENIVEISNNGGKYNLSSIDRAIDGNIKTHWETGRHNSSDFTNEVVLTVENKDDLIDRLVYATRQDGARGKGFPTEYEIYASNIEEGNNFRKIAEGSYTGKISEFVEIKFTPTKAKRFKFVFKKAYRDWASASEIWLYKEDKLKNKLDDLFVDESKTRLKEEYKDLNELVKLQNEIKGYPLEDYYMNFLNKGMDLISSKPEILGAYDCRLDLNSSFNPMSGLEGVDKEDGNITKEIIVKENNVNTSQNGVYKIVYELRDSSGRNTIKERRVIIGSKGTYLSELNWKSAIAGWKSVQKDCSVEGNKISLKGENGKKFYEKGIGTHSNSEIIYDLSNKGYSYFSSKIGVDQEMKENSPASIIFQVYVDGKKVYDSGVMRAKDNEKEILVNIEGAKELKLVVNDARNGNAADHGSFGDANLI